MRSSGRSGTLVWAALLAPALGASSSLSLSSSSTYARVTLGKERDKRWKEGTGSATHQVVAERGQARHDVVGVEHGNELALAGRHLLVHAFAVLLDDRNLHEERKEDKTREVKRGEERRRERRGEEKRREEEKNEHTLLVSFWPPLLLVLLLLVCLLTRM